MPIITLAGEKYRYIEVGETIQKGDIFVPDDNEDDTFGIGFLYVYDDLIGQVYEDDLEPIVRKINEA